MHPNLNWLYLRSNKLNDNDAIHLADALRHNRTLDSLFLQGNEFTSLGEDVLKKVIYDDSSLNAVSDSNHVCAIQGLGFYPWEIFVRGQYNVHRNEGDCRDDENGRKRSRAGKIFHLLEERNKLGTNAQHLEREMGENSLKVLPLALAAVQIYGEQMAKRKGKNGINGTIGDTATDELSITYELIRSWHIYFPK